MGARIPVRCFQYDPSIKSSLTFLRKTPWARKRVEDWYAWEATDLAMEPTEAASAASRLCAECGLCCNGVMFSHRAHAAH